MAINPFFLLGRHGTRSDYDYDAQGVGATSRSFLEQIVGVAPIAVGAGIGIKALQSNTPGSLLGLRTNAFRDQNASVGDSLKRSRAARAEFDKQKTEAFFKSIQEAPTEKVKQLLGEGVSERNAVLSSIIQTIDDAASGVGAGQAADIKRQLMEIMNKADVQLSEDATRLVQGTISTLLESSTPEGKSTFQRMLSRNKAMMDQIEAPAFNLSGLSPRFNPIEIGDTRGLPSAVDKFKAQIEAAMRGTGEVKVMGVQGPGGVSYYGHVFSGRGGGRFMGSVPLHLAKEGNVPVFRAGQSSTAMYSTDVHFADARRLLSRFRESGAPGETVWTRNNVDRLLMSGDDAAIHGFETTTVNDFVRRVNAAGGDVAKIARGAKGVGEFQRSFGTAQSRVASLPGSGPLKGHLLTQQQINHSSLTITGLGDMTPADIKELRQHIAYAEGGFFDIGGSHEIKRLPGGEQWTRVSIATGVGGGQGPMGLLTPLGVTDRSIVPGTARIRQVTGREGMFVQPVNPVGSTLGQTRTFQEFGQNVGWASELTGGMNKAVIMDVTDIDPITRRSGRLSLAEGEAWYGGRAQVRQAIQKSVLDPTQMTAPTTKLMNELLEGRSPWSTGAEGARGVKVTGTGEIKKFFARYGDVLGQGGDKMTTLSHYTGMQEMSLSFHSTSTVGDVRRIHLAGEVALDVRSPKFFSTLAKVTGKEMTPEVWETILQRTGIAGEMGRLGLGANQAIVAHGDMLKKGPRMIAEQMITGMGLMEGYGTAAKPWEGLFRSVTTEAAQTLTTASNAGRQRAYLENMASLTMNRMLSLTNAGARTGEMGMVMAGIYEHAGQFGFGGKDAGKEAMAGIIRREVASKGMGAGIAEDIITSAQRGMALGVTTVTPGPVPSIWRGAEGSMEPRFYQFLQHQVANLGMPANEANDFMAMVLARKGGMGEQLELIKSLSEMQLTLNGREGVLQGFKASKELKTLGIDDFLRGAGSEEAMARILGEHREGFILDLSKGGDFGGGRVGRAAEAGFGTSQIRIAGGTTMDMMRNIQIKTAEGNKMIYDEFTRTVHHLATNLNTIRQSADAGGNAELLRAWKGDMSKLFGDIYSNVLRGKMKGSVFARGQGLQLAGDFATPDLTAKQLGRAQVAFKRSGGSAVFMETQAFMDAMRGYMGGATESFRAVGERNAAAAARTEMGGLFKSFFLGMESRHTQHADVVLGRHPLLGPGHLAPSQVYRHAAETGQADRMFARFTGETEEGAAALRRFEAAVGAKEGGVKSFKEMRRFTLAGGDISRTRLTRNTNAQLAFFESMASNMGALAPTEGGGRVFIPNFEATVHYSGKKSVKMNLSFAAGMIGDFDGDMYQLLFPSSKPGTSSYFGKTAAAREAVAAEGLRYRAEVAGMMEAASDVIKKTAAMEGEALGPMTMREARFNELMKEAAGKDIGRIDVAFNKLRLGLVQTSKEIGYGAAQQGLAGLTALEEIISIKSKKHVRFKNVAAYATEAVTEMYAGGGSVDASKKMRLLLEETFKGTAIATKEGLSIKGLDRDALARQLGGEAGKISGLLDMALVQDARTISVDTLMEGYRRSAKWVADSGAAVTGTAFQNARMAGAADYASQRAWSNQVERRMGAEAGLALRPPSTSMGILEEVGLNAERIRGAAQRLDKRLLGPVAVGIGAAIGLKAIMGDEGYSPSPMLSAGEVMDSGVATAIRRGELFAPREDNMPTPESLGGGPQNAMMQRPINTGETYVSRQNAYQIRGEIPSGSGIRASMDFVAGIRGSGSIRINDTRRPLTSNYIDRLMGD